MKNMTGVVYAASAGTDYGVPFNTVGELVSVLLKNVYFIAGFLLLGLLIFGGIGVIMAANGGNAEKVAEGTKKVMIAIMGFMIVFLSWFIIRIIEAITGVNILSTTL